MTRAVPRHIAERQALAMVRAVAATPNLSPAFAKALDQLTRSSSEWIASEARLIQQENRK